MYFLGHFITSMAYRLGSTSTMAWGIAAFVALIFTLVGALRHSESKKGIWYGIICGFFLWILVGELLNHQGVFNIVAPEVLPVLIAYSSIVALLTLKRYVSISISYALGHFGCIWLNHFIVVNEVQLLQDQKPETFKLVIISTGLLFFFLALFLFFKLIKSKIEKAYIAYALFSFIFLWSVVEITQIFHFVPGYTYFSYWVGKLSHPASRNIESFTERYAWDCDETKELAHVILKGLPGYITLKDITARVDKRLKAENRDSVNETILCQAVDEVISTEVVSYYNTLIKRYADRYKRESKTSIQAPGARGVKTISVPNKYQWESTDTHELANYLLSRIPVYLSQDLTKRLDQRLKDENKIKVDEELFLQVFKESVSFKMITRYNHKINMDKLQYKSKES